VNVAKKIGFLLGGGAVAGVEGLKCLGERQERKKTDHPKYLRKKGFCRDNLNGGSLWVTGGPH